MTSQEWLSVDAAAARLGITLDAVRSRIKRGSLWAVRRNGRVQVVLREAAAREAADREVAGAGFAEHHVATQGPTPGPAPDSAPDSAPDTAPDTAHGESGKGLAKDEAATRLRAEIARQKHRVRDLERERGRLDRELARQRKFVDLEHALRARLQDQLDRLNERLSDALPEILDDPTERADRLWKRLGRQVERLGTGPGKPDD
jgi:hypothetical protein